MTASIEIGRRVLAPVALIAALALSVALLGGEAAHGDATAVAAAKKKNCGKKKGKASAAGKKKGKCKKKAKKPAPVVRATITWSNADADDADLDLFVFDAAGNRSGNGSNTIPNSTASPDVTGKNGTETFTDKTGGKRPLSFAVCYQVGGSAHAPFTITYTNAAGQQSTETRDPGSSFHYDFPAGPPIGAGYCPN